MGWVRQLRALAVVVVVVVLAVAIPAQASPLRLFGYVGRSSGTGGVGAATADDFESVYHNPAGLAFARKRLTVGGLVGTFDLRFDDDGADTELARGQIFGLAVPIPFGGALRDRVGLAVGLYVPNQTLNKAKAPFPGAPSFAIIEHAAHVISFQLGVGVRINERWAVGVGTRVLAALRGKIKILGDPAGRFTTRSEQQMVTKFAPVAGVQFRQSAAWSWGLNVTGVSRSGYDIKVSSDLGDAVPLDLPPLRIAGTPQYDPLTVVIEGAHRPTPALLVTAHLAYEHWPMYPVPTENPVDDPTVETGVSAGYHPIVVPKLAVDWTAMTAPITLQLRGGYSFAMSPAPEQTSQQSLFDSHRHVLATGLGIYLPDEWLPIRFDFWLQLHYLQPRRHTKDLGAFPDGPPPFESMNTDGTIFAGGMTVGVDL